MGEIKSCLAACKAIQVQFFNQVIFVVFKSTGD